jgi:hypothetical protein
MLSPVNSQPNSTEEDAMELARLLYDIYKDKQINGKVDSGQNNANHTSND